MQSVKYLFAVLLLALLCASTMAIPQGLARATSASPSKSPSPSPLPSPSPSPSLSTLLSPVVLSATNMLKAFQAQQVFLAFWFEVQGTYAVLAQNNLGTDEATARFSAIANKYTTPDVHLLFPFAGVDFTGRDLLTAALVAQTQDPSDGGNGGEHHVWGLPLVKEATLNSITMVLDDTAWVNRKSGEGQIFLGRKTFTCVYQPDGSMLMSFIELEVRSYFGAGAPYPNWFLLTQPKVEQ